MTKTLCYYKELQLRKALINVVKLLIRKPIRMREKKLNKQSFSPAQLSLAIFYHRANFLRFIFFSSRKGDLKKIVRAWIGCNENFITEYPSFIVKDHAMFNFPSFFNGTLVTECNFPINPFIFNVLACLSQFDQLFIKPTMISYCQRHYPKIEHMFLPLPR